LMIIPQSPTTATRVSPKRSLSFFTWLARVAGLRELRLRNLKRSKSP
jgi:hypothetical protein